MSITGCFRSECAAWRAPQRFAAFLAVAGEIADRLSPEDLTDSSYAIERACQEAAPRLSPRLASCRAHPGAPRSPAGARRQCRIRDRIRRADGNIFERSRPDSPPGLPDRAGRSCRAASRFGRSGSPGREIDVMLEDATVRRRCVARRASPRCGASARAHARPRCSSFRPIPWMVADAGDLLVGAIMTIAFLFPGQGAQSEGLLDPASATCRGHTDDP